VKRLWGWRTFEVAAVLLMRERRLLRKLWGGVGVMSAQGGFCASLVGAEVGFVVAGWIRVELVVFLIAIVILKATLPAAVDVALQARTV
jgi:hypothetical protein